MRLEVMKSIVSLNCFDDKQYILDDVINSYAYGHKIYKFD